MVPLNTNIKFSHNFCLLRPGFRSIPIINVQILAKAWWLHDSGQGPLAEPQARKHMLECGHKHHNKDNKGVLPRHQTFQCLPHFMTDLNLYWMSDQRWEETETYNQTDYDNIL